jgi:hypothetical protein
MKIFLAFLLTAIAVAFVPQQSKQLTGVAALKSKFEGFVPSTILRGINFWME